MNVITIANYGIFCIYYFLTNQCEIIHIYEGNAKYIIEYSNVYSLYALLYELNNCFYCFTVMEITQFRIKSVIPEGNQYFVIING